MVRMKKNKFPIKIITFILIALILGITQVGTYAYFTAGEKILPPLNSGTPVYNNFTINYTDHSASQILDEGVTVYFDISGYLTNDSTIADSNWIPPVPCLYFFVQKSGSNVRTSTWTDTSMAFRFASVSTINPTNLSKCKTSQSVNGTVTDYIGSLGGITWSGTWIKYKITNTNFNLNSGETRYIIIHRSANLNDQTANNMSISAGVKEVYIKAKAYNTAGGGHGSNYDWSKLEISY